MPRDGRDELGKIPEGVARFLIPNDKPGLAARTEANVWTAAAALIIVKIAGAPRATPGTAKTLELAALRHVPRMIADPITDPMEIARWIWGSLLTHTTLPLLLGVSPDDPHVEPPPRLLIAGPRESKWPGAQIMTTDLLRRIARALSQITSAQRSDLAP